MSDFIVWYFSSAIKSLINFFIKSLKFVLYFFGFSFHLHNFFSPWKQIAVSYGRGFRAQVFFSNFALNSTSRLIGAFLRFLIIIWTMLFFLFIVILGTAVIFLWLALPVLLVYLIISGVSKIF